MKRLKRILALEQLETHNDYAAALAHEKMLEYKIAAIWRKIDHYKNRITLISKEVCDRVVRQSNADSQKPLSDLAAEHLDGLIATAQSTNPYLQGLYAKALRLEKQAEKEIIRQAELQGLIANYRK